MTKASVAVQCASPKGTVTRTWWPGLLSLWTRAREGSEALALRRKFTRDCVLVTREQSPVADDDLAVDHHGLRARGRSERQRGQRIVHSRVREVVHPEERDVGAVSGRKGAAI